MAWPADTMPALEAFYGANKLDPPGGPPAHGKGDVITIPAPEAATG